MSGEQPTASAVPADPTAAVRGRGYLMLLVVAAAIGAPLSAAAWGFLQAVNHMQTYLYDDLPRDLGEQAVPSWWPLPLLFVAGVLVGVVIRYLPGTAGHRPAEGLKTGGVASGAELPGILIAALASIGLGAVVGPEAPLIALGGGLAALAVRSAKARADDRAAAMLSAAGSFAAVSTLFGNPLLGAFLLMEASGLGGAMLDVVLLPGLLASGIGALVFTGLDSWSGLPTTSLTISALPPTGRPNIAELGWALVIAVLAAVLGTVIRRAALFLQAKVIPRTLLLTPVMGLCVAGLAIAFAQGTGKPSSDVLFSGQNQMGPLISHSGSYTGAVLVVLVAFKTMAYCASLSAFRGGPVFPALFVGAAGGLAMSHLPGLPMVPGLAMGIGTMSVAMLSLPLTSVLLATLLLGKDGLTVMPLVIVAVVVCHVITVRIRPRASERRRTAGTESNDAVT